VIGDFDFDGHDDFAVQDGYNGSYGYASYDVYTYDKKRKIYSLNSALTRLAGGEYLGMFQIDKKRRRLLAYNKVADGILYSFEFTSNGRGLKKVCEKTEIWNQSNGIVEV
ncbi:XAC2610-related protein, partial [Staphylococcus aureus]